MLSSAPSQSLRYFLHRFRRWGFRFLASGLLVLSGFAPPVLQGESLQHQSRLPRETTDPGERTDSPLEALRSFTSRGDTVLRATLIHYPRRGRPVEWRALIWTRWQEGRPIYRIIAQPDVPERRPNASGIAYLINGVSKDLWRWHEGGESAQRLEDADWNKPMFPGLHLSPFDLVGGFLFLEPATDIGSARVKGRPVRLYEFPATGIGFDDETAAYRVGLDARFNAPLLAEALTAEGEVLRSLEVLNLRQIGDEWMIRATDFHDHRERSRVRLRIDAVALQVASDWDWTSPDELSQPTRLPREEMRLLR